MDSNLPYRPYTNTEIGVAPDTGNMTLGDLLLTLAHAAVGSNPYTGNYQMRGPDKPIRRAQDMMQAGSIAGGFPSHVTWDLWPTGESTFGPPAHAGWGGSADLDLIGAPKMAAKTGYQLPGAGLFDYLRYLAAGASAPISVPPPMPANPDFLAILKGAM